MSTILWLHSVKDAWHSYLKNMNRKIAPSTMEQYLEQELDMGMKLDEFAEAIFIAGFSAGEKYANGVMAGNQNYEMKLN
jgi:hypothetical protein